jgi:D-alanine-D-alanine ligase-like ATP-grasp enzyme
MSTTKNNNQKILDDIHPFLEKVLIEAYLKGKGYTLKKLKNMPEEEVKQLMKEASTYASGKLAEVEVKAHLMQELHDAYMNE